MADNENYVPEEVKEKVIQGSAKMEKPQLGK